MVESVNKPRLTIQTPEGVQILDLAQQETWTFGRSEQSTFLLNDQFASRHHAKIEVNRDGFCYFADLNSRNGTLYNNQPLTMPVWLKHGDRIEIGETNLIFECSQDTLVDTASTKPPLAVLMVQGSVTQGEIWQEIFNALNISMVWKDSGATLKQTLEARAIANTLPKLLLMDVRSHSNTYHFCRWCHTTFPQISIFLLDSMRTDISKIEHQIAMKNGALNLFPAMNRHNLVLRSTEVLTEINEVLSALGNTMLSSSELLSSLRLVNERMGFDSASMMLNSR